MWDGSRAVAGMPANPCGARQADHHQVGREAWASGERMPDAGDHRRGLKPQTQFERRARMDRTPSRRSLLTTPRSRGALGFHFDL